MSKLDTILHNTFRQVVSGSSIDNELAEHWLKSTNAKKQIKELFLELVDSVEIVWKEDGVYYQLDPSEVQDELREKVEKL